MSPFIHPPHKYITGYLNINFLLFLPSIHPIIRPKIISISSLFNALPFLIPCHFWIKLRQQVAVACWAIKTGCPLIGVCLPSFFGYRDAILVLMKTGYSTILLTVILMTETSCGRYVTWEFKFAYGLFNQYPCQLSWPGKHHPFWMKPVIFDKVRYVMV